VSVGFKFIDARTTRMSHEGERVNGARTGENRDRAPPHWLNPLVRPCSAPSRPRLSAAVCAAIEHVGSSLSRPMVHVPPPGQRVGPK
jgi:hypothetical protein